MGRPAVEDIQGYDVVLWVDVDGDIVATPYTPAGEAFIKKLNPRWSPDKDTVILTTPDRFFKMVPEGLVVGMQQPRGISTAITSALH